MISIRNITEDAAQDKAIRDKILADFEIVKNYVQMYLMDYETALHSVNNGVHSIIWGKDIDSESDNPVIHGFKIFLNKIIVLPSNINLVLLSRADTNQPIKGGIGRYKGEPALILYCLFGPGNEIAFKYINTRLDRTTYLHEMIHFYDKNRYKGDYDTGSVNKMNKGGVKVYFNNPEEYNAWTQELLNTMTGFVNIYKAYPDKMPKTFDAFYDIAAKLGEDFISELNPEYLNHLKKRLYQFYITFVAKKGD